MTANRWFLLSRVADIARRDISLAEEPELTSASACETNGHEAGDVFRIRRRHTVE